jgi:hypothetical protein
MKSGKLFVVVEDYGYIIVGSILITPSKYIKLVVSCYIITISAIAYLLIAE